MNAEEARGVIKTFQGYKFVCQLVPPMLAMANMSTGMLHATIGIKKGLVEVDVKAQPPYKIREPNNFKAGRLMLEIDGTVKLSGISTDFNDEKNTFASETELQTFFEIADIHILTF